MERLFPPLDGTAFYPVICHINHSCEHNVAVYYAENPGEGLVAQMHALRDILAEEELLQSYIDSKQSKTYFEESGANFVEISCYDRRFSKRNWAPRLRICLQLCKVRCRDIIVKLN